MRSRTLLAQRSERVTATVAALRLALAMASCLVLCCTAAPGQEEDDQPASLERPVRISSELLLERREEPEAGRWPFVYEAPSGFTGPSGVAPQEFPALPDFEPLEDRWRLGFPLWDRYGRGHPRLDDYPYVPGNILNPYRQNVLKGDYPIFGQQVFLNLTLQSKSIFELRQVPTPTTPFESTADPDSFGFFGNPNQFAYKQDFFVSVDLFHGSAGFRQADWRIKITTAFDLNYLDVEELAIVNPDVRFGTTRFRQDFALEEWFFETKLADLSPSFDTLSFRGGSQLFVSDFRGFIFADINRGLRLFGTRHANRDQFNVVWFDQQEKETNSELNTFDDRHQDVVILNYYRQDFIWPGYTVSVSFHYNHDEATFKFDANDFLVRPDPAGVAQPHQIDAYYLGFTGNGHINRYNISHAFYWVTGKDQLNPLAGRPVDINAFMAALELSYDRDWMRFRGSYFYASGDPDINDGVGEGFDAIFDNPNFAGGQFSYWQRQAIRLFGVNLTNRLSLVPNLRSSKIEGQTNFVNPGLHLVNVGVDAEVTPRFRLISNVNFLWFDQTEVLEVFVFQSNIRNFIGADLSLGYEYRPLLNNNVIILGGISGLIAGEGFEDLYSDVDQRSGDFFASFLEVILQY